MRCMCIVLVAVLLPLPIKAQQVVNTTEWLSSYREARRLSKEKNIPILIDVGGTNCVYCRKMDSGTLSHPDVIEVIRANFISLKLDAVKDRDLVNGLGVRLLPTFIIADPEGKVISSIEGFSPPDVFQTFMGDALAKIPRTQELTNLLADATKATGEGQVEKAKSLLQKIIDKEATTTIGKKAVEMLAELNNRSGDRSESADEANAPKQQLIAPGSLASRSVVKESKTSSLTFELLGKMISHQKSGKVVQAHELAEQIKTLAPGSPAELDAQKVIDDVLADPQALKQLVEAQSDRLANTLFQAAEVAIKQGQPQQAIYYLDRVSQVFPNSRFSNQALTRLAQIQGPPKVK